MSGKTYLKTSLIMTVFLMAMVCTVAGDVIYVDDDASLGGNGQSWATPYRYLQDALAAALYGNEIRVAEGIYNPDRGGGNAPGNRSATFRLKNGVAVKGGYAGLGQPDPDARDIELYETVLSGDLLGNDGLGFVNNYENSYHVVTGSGTNQTALLDGFTITAGNAYENQNVSRGWGGGMYNYHGSPTVTNCTFSKNWAGWDGGGMHNRHSSTPTVKNCKFIGNSAKYAGGMYHTGNSNSTIKNCTFSGNSARTSGGGMCNWYSSPTLINCTFSGNSAFYLGGGILNNSEIGTLMKKCTFINNSSSMYGGAIYNGTIEQDYSKLTLINCTFKENRANEYGGAIDNSGNTASTIVNCIFIGNRAGQEGGGMSNWINSRQTLANCTFSGNSAGYRGGGMNNNQNSLTMTNCILWGDTPQEIYLYYGTNTPVITHCDVQGGWPGIGNRNADPLFLDPAIGDYHLLPGSPCIDAGNNSAVPPSVVTDIDGNPRIIDGTVDMGAYEWPYLGFLLLLSAESVIVPEGGTATFTVALAKDPEGMLEVTVAVESGDPDITVESGGLLTFDSTNYSQPQTVTLAAAKDVDQVHGTTLILVSAPGVYPAGVNAYELDSEGPTVLYVDCDARGANDGSSWENAFTDLREGLSFVDGTFWVKEIRVAQGAYSPEGPLPDIRRARNPNPVDGARNVSITADLSWTAGPDATSHDVYFGTTSMGIFQGNQTAITFDPGTMAYYTKYYWRIDEISNAGKTTGSIWSFTTLSTPPPMGSNESQNNTVTVLDRTATFQLKNDVVIKGGYAGFGEPNADARDIEAYETILSGDLLGNDGPDFANNDENSYHVVTGSDCNESAVLDGFTITAGNANGEGYPFHHGSGGGIQIRFGEMGEKGPVLTNCTFIGNSARSGGGMYNDHAGTTITNCTFSENFADWGGGIGNAGYLGPKLVNCTFTANRAGYQGGAVATGDGRSTLENCTLIANHAELGGAIYNGEAGAILTNCTLIGNSAKRGGAVYNQSDSSVRMTNCLVSENSCTEEGGVVYLRSEDSATLTNCILTANSAEKGSVLYVGDDGFARLANCTLTGNRATDSGGALYFGGPDDAIAIITNCILWSNTPQEIYPDLLGSEIVITYNDVQGGWPGQGNFDADPCFVEPGYRDANGMWIDGDYHLLQTSACINTGDNNSLPADTQDLDGDGNTTEPIPFDLDGNPRIVYDVVDMGAFEFDNTAPIADAGDDQTIECACNTAQGTKVTLDGTNSSDLDQGLLTYTWNGPFVESPAHGAVPTVTLEEGCPGDYGITLVVDDGIDVSEPDEVVIRIVDTTPPAFEFSVAPEMLWPPDHKMVEITPSWMVSDDCDATPDVSLVSIVANEGDDTIGDGHTSNDIQIGEDCSIYLRSERSGTGSDRVYTITYQAVDDYGNTTVSSATVSIPHDFKVLARIAARWLWAGPGNIPEDLNGDGVVNLKDIAIFANNWIQ